MVLRIASKWSGRGCMQELDERERQTDRQTDRHRQRERDREREGKMFQQRSFSFERDKRQIGTA